MVRSNVKGGLEVDGVQVVTLTATQTLTNKTLTTPTIASPTFTGTAAGLTYTTLGTAKAGETVTVSAGGLITIPSTAVQIAKSVVAGVSSGNVLYDGVVTLKSTSVGNKNFKLPLPAKKGCAIDVFVTACTSAYTVTVKTTGATGINGSTKKSVVFGSSTVKNGSARFVALSSAAYGYIGTTALSS